MSGPITETGDADATQENGGITVTGNSGGSTIVSNATKTFNTGEDHAIVMGTSDGHTLTFSGGGLDIDTTSGTGVQATTSGTLTVTGTANTIDTGDGQRARTSATPTSARARCTFQRVSSNGANSGIRRNNTGSNGNLTVTGNGGTCTNADTTGCSGGVIENTTAPITTATRPEPASCSTTRAASSFTRMRIHDHSNYGIRGTNVTGFTLADSVSTARTARAPSPDHDGGLRFDGPDRHASHVTDTEVSGGYSTNVIVPNTAGTLERHVDGVDSGSIEHPAATTR